MKLSKLLHPEIVLGRRGTEKQFAFYKEVLPHVEIVPDDAMGVKYSLGHLNQMIQQDFNIAEHLCIVKKFIAERPNIYHVGKDFGDVLASVKKDLPLDKLPERFFGYISFSKGSVFDETGEVYGAYVFIGSGTETVLIEEQDRNRKVVWISYLGKSVVDDPSEFSISRLLMQVDTKDGLTELVNALPTEDKWQNPNPFAVNIKKEARLPVYRTILNAVLYIHCQEPNLEKLRGGKHLSNKDKKTLNRSGQNFNLCTVPVIAVNWGFQRSREYSVSETWVNEHWRWQRCGPQFSEIKLIPIKGHTRKYDKAGGDK